MLNQQRDNLTGLLLYCHPQSHLPSTLTLPFPLQVASEVYKDSAQSEDREGVGIDLSATNFTSELAEQVKEILAQMSCVFSKENTDHL